MSDYSHNQKAHPSVLFFVLSLVVLIGITIGVSFNQKPRTLDSSAQTVHPTLTPTRTLTPIPRSCVANGGSCGSGTCCSRYCNSTTRLCSNPPTRTPTPTTPCKALGTNCSYNSQCCRNYCDGSRGVCWYPPTGTPTRTRTPTPRGTRTPTRTPTRTRTPTPINCSVPTCYTQTTTHIWCTGSWQNKYYAYIKNCSYPRVCNKAPYTTTSYSTTTHEITARCSFDGIMCNSSQPCPTGFNCYLPKHSN